MLPESLRHGDAAEHQREPGEVIGPEVLPEDTHREQRAEYGHQVDEQTPRMKKSWDSMEGKIAV